MLDCSWFMMVSNPFEGPEKRRNRMSGRVHRSPKLFTLLPLPPPKKKTWNIHLLYFEKCNFTKLKIIDNCRYPSTMFGGKRRTLIHWQTLSSYLDSPVGNNNQTRWQLHVNTKVSQERAKVMIFCKWYQISSDCFLNSNDNSKSTAPFDFITINSPKSPSFSYLPALAKQWWTCWHWWHWTPGENTDRLWMDYGFPEWVNIWLINGILMGFQWLIYG